MTSSARKILDDALALPLEEREELVDALVTSLQRTVPAEVERAWIQEIRERLARLERGETSAIDWPEAQRDLRAKYRIG